MGENHENTAPMTDDQDDDRKIFIGGLPQEATEDDLKEYFSKFGEVANATIKMDQMTGRSRGFGFVVFQNQESLDQVLAEEHVIKSKKVAVKKAASKQGKIYIGKFQNDITEDDIRDHFSQFGTIVEIQRPVDRSKDNEPKNFCFITFEKEETASHLLKKATETIKGQEVSIKKVNVKSNLSFGKRASGGWSGGYDQSWGYGSWGYDMPPGGWGYGGWNAPGWGAPYGGGGKMGASGRGRGRGGRSAPY